MKFSSREFTRYFGILFRASMFSLLLIPVHVKKNVGIHNPLNNVKVANNYENFDANPHPVGNGTR